MSKIVRAISRDGSARIFVIDSCDIVNEAIKIHNTVMVSTAALGRALSAASLMGCMLKDETDSLTLKIKSIGEIKNIVCVSDYCGNVRGMIDNPEVVLPLNERGKLDVGGAIGEGFLSVIRDFGTGESFAGQIQLVSGEIAEDITEYFTRSEQTPTICALGVRVNTDEMSPNVDKCESAGGMLVQLLPVASSSAEGNDEKIIEILENNLETLPSISEMLLNHDCYYVIEKMFAGIEYDIFDEIPVEYRCTCSKERTRKVLAAVGKEDIQEMITDGKGAELCCHFCNEKYFFTTEELREIKNMTFE